tara:strand:- start:5539 stop:6378 length:840 start_codon:yes stop_codon:yes gene_type:complete
MKKEIDKVVVFGANGLIGRSFCKFLESKDFDFIAVSKSKENKYEYKNYFALDLENDEVWPPSLIEKIKNYKKIVFLSAVAHRRNVDVLNVNLKIFNNFLININRFKKTHSLLFISSKDIKFLKKSYALNASSFQISYAKSKKMCEDILNKQVDLENKILRLPMVFSRENSVDLKKRYCISFKKIKIFFKIFPSPLYEIVSTDELNIIFLRELNFKIKSSKTNLDFNKVSQHDLLIKESNFYLPIPKFLLHILFFIFNFFPLKIIRAKAIYFDKLIGTTI